MGFEKNKGVQRMKTELKNHRGSAQIVFFVILALLVAGGTAFVIFVRQFNPNDYRPSLEARLSESLGMDVKLGRLSMEWKFGLGLQADKVELRNRAGAVPIVAADRLFFRFNPFLLLRGQLIASEVTLSAPVVLLIRNSNGSNGSNWEKVTEPPKKKEASVKMPGWVGRWFGGFTILFSKVQVERGTLLYRDETQSAPVELAVRDLKGEFGQEWVRGAIRGRGEGRFLHPSEPDLFWNATWQEAEQELDFELKLKGEGVFKGKALPFQKPLRFKGGLQLENFEMGRLPFALSGLVSGNVALEGAGQTEEEIKKSLSGDGNVHIRDGRIRNFNVVQSVLSRATVIPGLSEALVGAMPPSFRSVVASRDTHFDLIQTDFELKGSQSTIHSLVLKDANYQVQAEGVIGLDGQADLRAQLVLLDEFSQFLVKKVKELVYLQNEQGLIVIPFVYRGRWPRATPQPDLAYLAERLVVDQGARLLQRGLEALSQRKQPQT